MQSSVSAQGLKQWEECAGTCSWDAVTYSEALCAVNVSSVHPSELEEWQVATESITTCSEQDLTVTDPTSNGGCAAGFGVLLS